MKINILLLTSLLLIVVRAYAQVPSTDGTFTATTPSNLSLRTGTTPTPRLTILNSNGYVGIGIPNPANITNMLQVGGDIFSTGNMSASGNITATQFSANTGSFNSAAGSNLSFNTNGTTRLTLLNSNGYMGIGTTTPSAMLHVNGSVLSTDFASTTGNYNSAGTANLSFQTNGASRLTVLNSNGYVGIGTSSPEQLLHISGGNVILDNATPTIYTGTSANNRYLFLANYAGQPSPSGLKAGGILISENFNYANPSRNDLVVQGTVAIGTPLANNPNGYALAVNGKIGAKDIQVETKSSTWPDFVFSAHYHLPSLYEVERYVQQNQHLQDVPSAKEIEEKHNLGEMDAVLLKKIEELTLYIIEQQKQIDTLKKEMQDLKK